MAGTSGPVEEVATRADGGRERLRLALLSRVSRELAASALDAQRICEETARTVAELIGSGCAVRLVEPDGVGLRLVASHHRRDDEREFLRRRLANDRLRVDQSFYPELFQTGRVLFAFPEPELFARAFHGRLREFAERWPVTSIAASSLGSRGLAMGALSVWRGEGEPLLTDDDARLVEEIAERMGLALDHARLFEAEQKARQAAERAAANAKSLARFGARLAGARLPADVARVVAEESRVATGASGSRLVGRFGETEALSLVGAGAGSRQPFDLDADTALARAHRERRALYFESAAAYLDAFPDAAGRVDGAEAACALPLVTAEGVVGAWGLVWREKRPFDEPEQQYLETLAHLGAEALVRARLTVEADRARRDLVRQRDLLRSTFEQAPFAVAVTRGERHELEFANPAAAELFGIGDGTGRTLGETVAPAMADLTAFFDSVLATGRLFVAEDVEVEGGLTLDLLVQPRRGPSSEVVGVILVAVDATERAAARAREQAAVRARAEETAILDMLWSRAPVGLAFFDEQLRYVRANEMIADINGIDLSQYPGRTPAEMIPDIAPGVVERLRSVRDGEALSNVEVTVPPGGRIRPGTYLSSYYPVRDRERFLGIGALVVDITERRRGEEERARLLREAQAAVRLRDEFLSIAGHELRTPITALILQLEGVVRQARKAEPPVDPRALERIESASLMTRRLAKLIDALLDVTRLSSGRVKLDREPFDLAELVAEVGARFRDQAAEARADLAIDAPPGLVGEWDRARLDQVLTNLLSNALKYGAGAPVDLRATGEGDRVRLSVRDRGIGIGPEHHARIFGRFERAVSDRNYGGLGIGLWVSRQIVEAHGGHITVESAPGQGALFVVDLPRS